MKNIESVQDLIDLLNSVEDKSKHLDIQGIVGYDSNCRTNSAYFYKAKLWGKDITGTDNVTLILE